MTTDRLAALLHEDPLLCWWPISGIHSHTIILPSDPCAAIAARLAAAGVRVETPHDTTTIARFWSKVNVPDHDQCWDWTGSTTGDGYGQFWLDGRIVRAHRFSYEAHYGPVPDGMAVMHRCDHPSCVRPDHLRAGTVAENNADMRAKGRDGGVTTAKAAQTECENGHPFDDKNTRVEGRRRQCRACGVERQRRYRQRRKAATA